MTNYKVPSLENFQWQQPVISKELFSPPVSFVKGDRYIVASSGSGDWVGQTNNIAIYSGTEWEFTLSSPGMILWVSNENQYYSFNGSNWNNFPNTSLIIPISWFFGG